MTYVYFEGENLEHDHENENFHSYEVGEITIIPNVGDIVDFDDDGYYEEEKRKANGVIFIVTKKTIELSRGKGYIDDCCIRLHIEPYIADSS